MDKTRHMLVHNEGYDLMLDYDAIMNNITAYI